VCAGRSVGKKKQGYQLKRKAVLHNCAYVFILTAFSAVT
jgi:hypothetical protein